MAPRVLGVVPMVLGVVPGVLGVIHRVLGVVPSMGPCEGALDGWLRLPELPER